MARSLKIHRVVACVILTTLLLSSIPVVSGNPSLRRHGPPRLRSIHPTTSMYRRSRDAASSRDRPAVRHKRPARRLPWCALAA